MDSLRDPEDVRETIVEESRGPRVEQFATISKPQAPNRRTGFIHVVHIQNSDFVRMQLPVANQPSNSEKYVLRVGFHDHLVAAANYGCGEQVSEPRLEARVEVQFGLLDTNDLPLSVDGDVNDWSS